MPDLPQLEYPLSQHMNDHQRRPDAAATTSEQNIQIRAVRAECRNTNVCATPWPPPGQYAMCMRARSGTREHRQHSHETTQTTMFYDVLVGAALVENRPAHSFSLARCKGPPIESPIGQAIYSSDPYSNWSISHCPEKAAFPICRKIYCSPK